MCHILPWSPGEELGQNDLCLNFCYTGACGMGVGLCHFECLCPVSDSAWPLCFRGGTLLVLTCLWQLLQHLFSKTAVFFLHLQLFLWRQRRDALVACSMWRGSPGAPTFIVFYSVYILQAELLPGLDRSIFPANCMDRTYPFLATVWLQAQSQLSKDDPQPLQLLMDKLVLRIPLPLPPSFHLWWLSRAEMTWI